MLAAAVAVTVVAAVVLLLVVVEVVEGEGPKDVRLRPPKTAPESPR